MYLTKIDRDVSELGGSMNVEYRDSELPFRDIGQCIYCGDKTAALSREHVLPRGLAVSPAEGMALNVPPGRWSC